VDHSGASVADVDTHTIAGSESFSAADRLVLSDIGEPDVRSSCSYLFWLIKRQRLNFILNVFWGCFWMVSLGLIPWGIGQGIDAIAEKRARDIMLWAGVLLGLTVASTIGSVVRHRYETFGRLKATYLTVRLLVRQATRLGARLGDRITVGEVVSIGTADISQLGLLPAAAARDAGSLVTIALIAVVLLTTSVPLGLVLLVGVPVLLIATGPALRPLHARVARYRTLQGELTGRADDIVSGLRVLRGIGGEEAFVERYRRDSQQVRQAGVQVAKTESFLRGADVLLPGILVIGVVWLGARLALSGSISVGALVSAYAYAAFLVFPLRVLSSDLQLWIGANVAARHVVNYMAIGPDPTAEAAEISLSGDLTVHDAASGLTILPGLMTVVAASSPEQAAEAAARLGRYAQPEGAVVTVDGIPLSGFPLEQVRRLILVMDNDQMLFTGVLGEELGGQPEHELVEALRTANAMDIVEALPGGLRGGVAEAGRSFSGGQQQRLRLARALLAAPEILVMVEPTSAVDARTESLIAGRVRQARAGRTTVVMSTSPLWLSQADAVVYIEGGKVVATGAHSELMASIPRYAATVIREGG